MSSKLVRLFLIGKLSHACAKIQQRNPPVALERPVPSARHSQGPDAAVRMDLQNKPDALPPLAPFTDGKRVHIKPIEDYIEALEIALPKGFELTYDDNGELKNSVWITGPGLEIEIGPPQAGFFTLAEHMVIYRNNDKTPVFYRAEETKEGYLLLVGDLDSEVGYQFTVSRPNLKVTCFAGSLQVETDTLEKADLAASICLSLRAAQPN